jgi:hypothetical protein
MAQLADAADQLAIAEENEAPRLAVALLPVQRATSARASSMSSATGSAVNERYWRVLITGRSLAARSSRAQANSERAYRCPWC